jgi:hypothetical protein
MLTHGGSVSDAGWLEKSLVGGGEFEFYVTLVV